MITSSVLFYHKQGVYRRAKSTFCPRRRNKFQISLKIQKYKFFYMLTQEVIFRIFYTQENFSSVVEKFSK